jgi:hypothetical protein
MKDFISVSPLRILEQSACKGLGPGHLGVLIARAGVGKTACLIHIAFDRIFRGGRLVHVSLEEGPEKVVSYYNVIYTDLVKALEIEDAYEYRLMIDRNRMILAYLNRSFEVPRLRDNLENLSKNLDFTPGTLIVDGLDFERANRAVFEGFKGVAEAFNTEIWFSARSHRHIQEVNERGIPYPCHRWDDLFSIIIHLQAEPSGIFLKLLKAHDGGGAIQAEVRLDPNSFLAMG